MSLNRKRNAIIPKWALILVTILILAGYGLLTKIFFDKNEEVKGLKGELIDYSKENLELKDSLNSLGILYKDKSYDLNLLSRKYKREKKNWEERIKSLESEKDELIEKIDVLMLEKEALIAEKDSLVLIKNNAEDRLNKGLNELSLGQIEVLKKKIKEKERELLKKDKKLYEYREARDSLSEELYQANKRFLDNEAFVLEMTTALVDFYNYLRTLESNTFSLKDELKKITKNEKDDDPNHGYIEGTKIALDIPANELYGGSPFLKEMAVRMKDHKREVETLRSKQEKVKEIMQNYDASLPYDDLLGNVESIIHTIEIQENEILDYEIALRTRYLLIASTERLKNMGIVLRNDWRRPRPKRKIDLSNIDLNQFSEIDYEHDATIKIPDSTKFRSIVTFHKEWSRNINERENIIYIRDKPKFWEISSILIIETE